VSEIQWAERYRTGIPFIDAQHHELFRVVARLQESLARNVADTVLRDQLDDLLTLLKEHFRDEEDFLRRYEYPDLLSHLAEHTGLFGELEHIKVRYEQAAAPLASMIGTFLGGWLRHHISEGDFLYAKFLRERGISAEAVSAPESWQGTD
jgi:hemerythrin-like metal-binding protein